MSRLQALGDSFTCGAGVGVQVPVPRTWSALLAGDLGIGHDVLAAPGARIGDVLRHQLPRAEPAAASTLLVGLNDAVRPHFDGPRLAAELWQVVERLSGLSSVVLLGRLHDPATVLGLPALVRRRLHPRLAAVNAAVDEAARLPRVRVLDLAAIPGLRLPGCWSVDRVHPSAAGHRVIAQEAAALLGLPVRACEVDGGPNLVERAWWKTRHGAPYLAGKLLRRG